MRTLSIPKLCFVLDYKTLKTGLPLNRSVDLEANFIQDSLLFFFLVLGLIRFKTKVSPEVGLNCGEDPINGFLIVV